MNNLMELKYAYPELYQQIRFRLVHDEPMRDYLNSRELETVLRWAENHPNGDMFYAFVIQRRGLEKFLSEGLQEAIRNPLLLKKGEIYEN